MGILVAVGFASLPRERAEAQFTVGAGVESFHWTEHTTPRQVEEQGPLAVADLGWTQRGPGPRPSPWRLAYRSRYYWGWVDYSGSLLFQDRTAASGTSQYTGTRQEGQLRRRIAPVLDAYGSLGIELWRRSLGSNSAEDFTVRYARLGLGNSAAWPSGWMIDGGVTFVMGVTEDAHLTHLGFDQNPRLEPRGVPSGYARVGYRLRERWNLSAYVDGYRFKESAPVAVSGDGNPSATVFQPASQMRVLGLKLTHEF